MILLGAFTFGATAPTICACALPDAKLNLYTQAISQLERNEGETHRTDMGRIYNSECATRRPNDQNMLLQEQQHHTYYKIQIYESQQMLTIYCLKIRRRLDQNYNNSLVNSNSQ